MLLKKNILVYKIKSQLRFIVDMIDNKEQYLNELNILEYYTIKSESLV